MATREHAAQAGAAGVRIDAGVLIRKGLVGGLVAGISFAIFEMIVALIATGSFFGPLRMIGATGIGQQALSPDYPLGIVALTGVGIHLAFSVVMGLVLGLIMSAAPSLAGRRGLMAFIGSVYGLLIWLVMFYLVAPAAGWNWFPERANAFWQGFVAHTFLYGAILGLWLSTSRSAHTAVHRK